MSAPLGSRAIKNLEVRHLRLLVAVAELGSIRATATALGLAQPNISQQLQRIERQFAAPIFHRSTNGVRPTEYGAEILVCAAEILERMDSIGAIRPISVLRHRYFDLDISTFNIGNSCELKKVWESAPALPVDGVRDVMNGMADIFVGVHWPHTPWPDFLGLTAVNLFSINMQVMVRDDHPLAGDENAVISLDSLRDEQWICRNAGNTTELECGFFGFSPPVRVVDCPVIRGEMLEDGAVCFVNPHSAIPDGFRALRYVGASPIHHLLHYHRERITAAEVGAIVRAVQDTLSQSGTSPELLLA